MQQDLMAGLAQLLHDADRSDPRQVAEAEALAGNALMVAMAFVQERFGKDTAALVVDSVFEQAAAALGAGKAEGVGVSIPTLHPAPRKEPAGTVQGQAEQMLGYLRGRPPAEADAEARASIWAAAAFLRDRTGEGAALEWLRFIQSRMSLLAWFEQLPVASATRH